MSNPAVNDFFLAIRNAWQNRPAILHSKWIIGILVGICVLAIVGFVAFVVLLLGLFHSTGGNAVGLTLPVFLLLLLLFVLVPAAIALRAVFGVKFARTKLLGIIAAVAAMGSLYGVVSALATDGDVRTALLWGGFAVICIGVILRIIVGSTRWMGALTVMGVIALIVGSAWRPVEYVGKKLPTVLESTFSSDGGSFRNAPLFDCQYTFNESGGGWKETNAEYLEERLIRLHPNNGETYLVRWSEDGTGAWFNENSLKKRRGDQGTLRDLELNAKTNTIRGERNIRKYSHRGFTALEIHCRNRPEFKLGGFSTNDEASQETVETSTEAPTEVASNNSIPKRVTKVAQKQGWRER